MAKHQVKPQAPGLRFLYFGPGGLGGGIGGSARLRNMLDVLRNLESPAHLISYLPSRKFGVSRQKVNDYLTSTAVSVSASAPKIAKLPALKLVFYLGLRYAGKSDIILAHSPGLVYGFPALVMAKLFRKPLFIDHMDIRDPDTPAFLYRGVLRRADVVLAISRHLETEARQIGSRRVVYLPVFVNTGVFQPDAGQRSAIRKKLGIGGKDIVIGYAGSFWNIEGVPFLIKAFRRIAEKHPNVKLVLIGESNVPQSDNVGQLVRELDLESSTVLVPPQPYAQMPAYLSAFDIACAPKLDCPENRAANPIKIFEYMSMGLIVVASAVGEPASLIENGVDGFLTPPGDAESLAGMLEQVVTNIESLRETGRRARAKIIRQYSQEAIQQELMTLIMDFKKNE